MGSEMCIRDRGDALDVGEHDDLPQAILPLDLARALAAIDGDEAGEVDQLPGARPVSYTHLTLPTSDLV